MARFILIDNASGYIFGDTADMPQHTFADSDWPVEQSGLTPVEAARWMDEAVVGTYGRFYENVSTLASNETGYFIYRADINGSDAVPYVSDGQSAVEIADVLANCDHVATVRCANVEG